MKQTIFEAYKSFAIIFACIFIHSLNAHSITESYLHYVTEPYLETYWWGKGSGKSMDRYQSIIDKVIAKEKEFQNTHYPFYNATTLDYLILSKVFNELQCKLENICWVDFELLRAKQDLFKSMNGIEDFFNFMDSFPENERNDHNDAIRKVLLSVNLSFPGAISHDESTFYYFTAPVTQFFDPQKAYRSHIKSTLLQFQQIKNLSPEKINNFVEKITSLQHYISTIKSGLLRQIFIPKKCVDTYVYLSVSYGHPYGSVEEYGTALKALFPHLWNEKKQHFTKISPILDELQLHPNIIERDEYDYLQARIVMSKDLFESPKSGVKIFTYSELNNQEMSELDNAINKVVDDIIVQAKNNHTQ